MAKFKVRVKAGPSPFGDWDAYQNFKRATKKQQQAAGTTAKVQRQLQAGWNNSRGTKPAMRTLTSSRGEKYQVPEDHYQDYMTFFRSAQDSQKSEGYSRTGKYRDVVSAADYIDYAFGKNTRVKPIVQEGCGHIALLEYSPWYQILRVTFTNNGSVVAFFRVPKLVAGTLMSLAQSKATRHDGRHVLGIYFWDLVRIRGTVHGSRYKFEYVLDNSTGNLPGRPYGSGENFYVHETGPDKNIQAKLDALNKAKTEVDKVTGAEQILQSAMNEDERTPEDLRVLQGMLDMLHGNISSEEVQAKLDERIKQLEAEQHDVVRNVNVGQRMQSSDVDHESLGSLDAFVGLTPEQQQEVEYAKYALRGDLQNREIGRHNAKRRMERSWDAERVSDKVQELVSQNKFGRGIGVEAFNAKFPNATQQFDYLKSRGFIPADARYINS